MKRGRVGPGRHVLFVAVLGLACCASPAAGAAQGSVSGWRKTMTFLGLAPSPGNLSPPKKVLSAAERQAAEEEKASDETLLKMKGSVERTIEIDATPEEVFMVASDFPDYPKWAGVQKIEVDEKDGHGMGKVVSMDVGMFGRHLKYTLLYTHDKPKGMRWHSIAGSIKRLVGSYQFVPIGPNRTKVIYKVFVDPGFYLPAAVRIATSRMVAMCALKELKKFTERPTTKAALAETLSAKKRGGPFRGLRSFSRQVLHQHNEDELHVPASKHRNPVWMLCCLF